MGLIDVRSSHCVSMVLIKAFTVFASWQACLEGPFKQFLIFCKSFFSFDQSVKRPFCWIVLLSVKK